MPNDTLRTVRKTEAQLQRELLEQLVHQQQTTTDAMARLAGGIVNDVLAVETVTFPADGFVHRQWKVAAGVVEVDNRGTNDVTVVSSGPGSAAPAGGKGVYIVPAGALRRVNIASRQVTLYGTEDDSVSYQALTSGGATGGALGAVDGGSA